MCIRDRAPPELQEMKDGLKEAGASVDLDFQRDILPHIGTTFTFSNGAADGWLTGTTFTASTKDGEKLKLAINDMFRKLQNQKFMPFQPGSRTLERDGYDIQMLTVSGFPLPVTPCWSFLDDRIVGALYPSSLPTALGKICLLYTSPSPRDATLSRMPSSA